MNKYEIIYEELQDRINSGELTLEVAELINDRAYEKYVLEASKKDADRAEEQGRKNITLRKGANISNDSKYNEDIKIRSAFDPSFKKEDYPLRNNHYEKTPITSLNRKHKIRSASRSSDGNVPDIGADPRYSKDANPKAVKKYKKSCRRDKRIDVERTLQSIKGDTKKRIIKQRIERGDEVPESAKKYIKIKDNTKHINGEKNGNHFIKRFEKDEEKDFQNLESLIRTMQTTKDYPTYKKAHDRMAKLCGYPTTDSFDWVKIDSENREIRFRVIKKGSEELQKKNDDLVHSSKNSNINELTPTFKSTDGVLFSSPRVYFNKNSSGNRFGNFKMSIPDGTTKYKLQSSKQHKLHTDNELGGAARYINTTNELDVKKENK